MKNQWNSIYIIDIDYIVSQCKTKSAGSSCLNEPVKRLIAVDRNRTEYDERRESRCGEYSGLS